MATDAASVGGQQQKRSAVGAPMRFFLAWGWWQCGTVGADSSHDSPSECSPSWQGSPSLTVGFCRPQVVLATVD
eukprot:8395768-Pyramimonas_sp.AAC.1